MTAAGGGASNAFGTSSPETSAQAAESGGSQDVLQLLMPEASESARDAARRVVTCLRLVRCDASVRRAERVQLELGGARREFERQERRELLDALQAVLCWQAAAARSADSFLDLPAARCGHADAWRRIESKRAGPSGLPELPAPGESPLCVAQRVLDAAERLGAELESIELWRARWTALDRGPRAGRLEFAKLLDGRLGRAGWCAPRREARAQQGPAGSSTTPNGVRPPAGEPRPAELAEEGCAELCAGLLACHLDLGDVRAAQAAVSSWPSLPPGTRLARLVRWSALLSGQSSSAAESDSPPGLVRSLRLPSALVDLRAARSDWLLELVGRAAVDGAAAYCFPVRERADVGAGLLALFRLDAAGSHAELMHLELSPGWLAQSEAWLEARDACWRRSAELEHRAIAGGAAVVERASAAPQSGVRGAIDARQVRAAAVVPLLSNGGAVLGWLRLEFEHELVPSERRLIALADGLRERLLGVQAAVRVRPAAGTSVAVAEPVSHAALADSVGVVGQANRTEHAQQETANPTQRGTEVLQQDPRAACFEAWVRQWGGKLHQRRWWGFVLEEGLPQVVAGGGQGLLHGESRDAGAASAGGLRRALACAGLVQFETPNPALSQSPRAASGLALAVLHAGRVLGALVVESSRRRDFSKAALASLESLAPGVAAQLRCAQFDAWHRAEWGSAVHLDATEARTTAWLKDLRVAIDWERAVLLSGPAGSGKLLAARLLHFERGAHGNLRQLRCGGLSRLDAAGLRAELVAARGGSVVLAGIERLDFAAQRALLGALGAKQTAGDCPRASILCTSRVALDGPSDGGLLLPELVTALQRVELRVPALGERRTTLPSLSRALLADFARERGVQTPELEDAALALLWRQAWKGNVRELGNLLFRTRPRADGHIGSAEIETAAASLRVGLLRRVPSGRPPADCISQALETTRNACGSINRTRAALYLGWDPDTLGKRLPAAGRGRSAER